MKDIPRSALLLGLAGLLPFFWGALTLLMPALSDWSSARLGDRMTGATLMIVYGLIILSFMSGVLWGFAAQAPRRQAALGYALSVLPALWAFFSTGGGPVQTASNLCIGFGLLLLLDVFFWRLGLAPRWWMHLRVGLTLAVLAAFLPLIT